MTLLVVVLPLDRSIDRVSTLSHFVHAIVATTVVDIAEAGRVSLRHRLLLLSLSGLRREHDVLLTDLHVFRWTITPRSVSVRDALILILGLYDVTARPLNGLSFGLRRER